MVLMELIVDLVREVMLSGPEGADSGPDLPILHTAQPLSCCNYLSHSERVGFGGRGVVGDNTCTWPYVQPNPLFGKKWHEKKKSTSDMHVYLRPWLPWPSPFLVPSNYLWAYWAVGTTACCQWSTQGDVGLMHTRRPLWLGLTTASFALRDGAFISYSSKISGEEHTYLHTWPHMKQSITHKHARWGYSIELFRHNALFACFCSRTFTRQHIFFDWILAATLVTEQQYIHGTYDEKSNYLKTGSQALNNYRLWFVLISP